MLRIRESLGAKLLTGLLFTVGLLLIVTFTVVRSETARQVELVSEEAVASALIQFEALEDIQRQLTDRIARPFVEGPRALARLDEAVRGQGLEELASDVAYEFQREGLLGLLLVTLTNPDGAPVLSILPDGTWMAGDPIEVGRLAKTLVQSDELEMTSYRVMNDRLYYLRDRVILNPTNRVIGTIAIALRIENTEVERVGSLLGIEVCFAAEGRCLAGTQMAQERFDDALAGLAGAVDPVDVFADGIDWRIRSIPLVSHEPELGAQVIAVPLNGVVAPFKRIMNALFLGGGAALALSLLFGLFLSRRLTRPVLALVRATGAVARGDYETEVAVTTKDEIGTLARAFNDMTRGLLLKERYRSVLNKVVSKDVAEELMKGEVELGGENRHITVLFADIRGFTGLTEGMEPQEVIRLLNDCMEGLSIAVEQEGGVVDKYVGDELMAVFGAPVAQSDDALRAVRAAVRMKGAMVELNAGREERGDTPIGLGIGLSTGLVVAGNIGSKNRLNYTVLGDTVNLGARLCSGASPGQVLISESTRTEAGSSVEVEWRGAQSFKGFSSSIEVFEVVGVRSSDATGAGRGGAGADPEVAPATKTGVLATLLLSGSLAVASAGSATLAAQDWPTLSDAGIAYLSSDGGVKLDVSGQLDLEVLTFTGHNAGLAYGRGTFVAPRIRLFTDVFLGDRVYGLLELRSDRGEAPTVDVWEARVEQVFARVSNLAGTFAIDTFAIQAGRFASPFGSYAGRHLTMIDPFIRPPLTYDYRTIISRTTAPPDADRFLEWKDEPAMFRHRGAPPI